MCKAHVLRFRCGHGVLMSFDTCRLGPCPVLKTTGQGLSPQPFRCYNCQHKLEQNNLKPTLSRSSTSSTSSVDSVDSSGTQSASSGPSSFLSHPLPGVAVQPAECIRSCRGMFGSKSQSISTESKRFSFACNSSSHFLTPHYSDLPAYLPHQNHACPPCQLVNLRAQADTDVAQCARGTYPNLKEEMLVHDGRTFDPETMTKPTLDMYVDERRTEEREMWFHVTRKWTQDLKRARILVAEEDGLGLLG